MKNPFPFGAKGAVEAAASKSAVPPVKPKPMLTGSTAMMLKGMGIDPDQVGAMADTIVHTLVEANERMARMEAQQLEILALLKAQSEVIGLNADVVRAVQAEAGGAP